MAGVCLGTHQRWARWMGAHRLAAAAGRGSRRSPVRLRRPRAGCGKRRDGEASSRTRRVVVVRARQWRDGLAAGPRTGTAGRELQMSQTKNFNLPDLGEGLPDATIVEWFVKEGDVIKLDEPLVSMETAKAVVEVPSPFSGTVLKLSGAAGDIIPTGSVLASFELDPNLAS
ncbi:pyruvate dehydrogenase E2 component (dihydrolipoamide acetyltransferase) [Stenotrophomonas maltophilia RA8]|nr:pyruvate dehydrogenase E2 component (dihydrolipoamide acetyltransferase) [Stenotrophomonas maltophilia RA8]